MNIIWLAVAEFGKTHSIEETDVLARKLLGLDVNPASNYLKDEKWITVKGTHVRLDKNGEPNSGPRRLRKELKKGKSGSREGGSVEDVTEEYKRSMRPGKGAFFVQHKVDAKKSVNEIKIGKENQKRFGGNLIVLAENHYKNDSNPDYIWRGGLWDLKTPESSSFNAFDLRVRSGLTQTKRNPYGVIFDLSKCGATFEEAKQHIELSLRNRSDHDMDVLMVDKNGEFSAFRYKVKKPR